MIINKNKIKSYITGPRHTFCINTKFLKSQFISVSLSLFYIKTHSQKRKTALHSLKQKLI